jgi:hypothetical protein
MSSSTETTFFRGICLDLFGGSKSTKNGSTVLLFDDVLHLLFF